MFNKRWVIEFSGADVSRSLLSENELASLVQGSSGKQLLLFRDSLTAFKAASRAGRRAQAAYVMVDSGDVQGEVAHLDDGTVLVLEPPESTALAS